MWWDTFKVETSIATSSISEIGRFAEESVRRADDRGDTERAAHHLLTMFETIELHFEVDVTDPEGADVTTELQAILSTSPAPTKALWAPHLSALALLMTERLVAYRQDTNPSDALTAKLMRFINGLRRFVELDGSGLTDLDAQRWTKLVQRIGHPREKLTDPKWHRSLLRASRTPLAQLASFGAAINDDLRKHRQHRASDSASSIFELQEREIATLEKLRSGLERSFERLDSSQGQVSLHPRCVKHLFPAKTYFLVTSEVDLVYRSSPGDRHHSLILLQKRFELLALTEVQNLLRNATTCYRKIISILDSSKPMPARCMGMLEQIAELYWLQKRTLNQPHADVEVDTVLFRRYARSLAMVDEKDDTNTDMWSPSLLKLEDMVRAKKVTGEAVEYLYDVLLANKYLSARDRHWHSVGTLVAVTPGPAAATPSRPASAASSSSPAIPVTPSNTPASTTIPPPPKGTGTDVTAMRENLPDNAFLFEVVVKQRNVLRALLRDTQATAANVQRMATLLDASVVAIGPFVVTVLLPFLAPVLVQWNTRIEIYMKPLSGEHEDQRRLEQALGLVRDSEIERKELKRDIHAVGTTLSSSNVLVLQALKVVRLFMQIGAAFVSQKVFNESYMRKVFAEGRDPPPLTSMLFLMLSIDATAHLMVVLVLVLTNFVFKTDTNTFLIDELFLADVLTEFAVSSLVLILLGVMLADTMRRKRYFQYPDQGQVVSKAYRSALIYICVVNFVVPFSMLVS